MQSKVSVLHKYENGPHIEHTSREVEGGTKKMPYIFRPCMINKMYFFFIDIKNEST